MKLMKWLQAKLKTTNVSEQVLEPNTIDLLDWFQAKCKATYPKEVQDLINFAIKHNTTIDFSYESYGEYDVLKFNHLANIINGQSTPYNREDVYSNPYFVLEKVKDFINSCFPNEGITQVLPFACYKWGDRTWFIFFTENNEFPMLVNIDDDKFKPKRSHYKISKFIPIESLLGDNAASKQAIIVENKSSYKDIVSEAQTFVIDGECISGFESYKELLEDTLALSMGKFAVTAFSGNETNNIITLSVEINNTISGEITLQGGTDWIDASYIPQLNAILKNHLDGSIFSEFRDWDWGQEFGVVYASIEKIEKLGMAGYVNAK